ncbi:MAG: N-acetyltransferase [Mycobacteriaceae bacterium]
MSITVRPACDGDAAELAEVAAATFPLACPASTDPGDITAAIAGTLSPQRFAEYLADPQRVILVATDDGRIVGYTMLIRGIGEGPDIAASVRQRPAVELSKMYVLAAHHGSGPSDQLMQSGIAWATDSGAAAIWLGVNRKNQRAQRFYRRYGFRVTGTRRFRLGESYEDDFVMVRPI